MQSSQRFRGIFGLSAIWGVALSAVATSTLVLGLATGIVPDSIYGVRELVAVAARGLVVGAVAGGLFGWILTMRERHATLATLSSKRMALWGSIAAGSVPVLITVAAASPILPLGIMAASVAAFASGGGVFAASLLRIARRRPTTLVGAADESQRRLR